MCAGKMAHPGPVVIVGGGRIGRAFLQIVGDSGVLVKREERILGRSDGAYSENTPILVATHCSHLDNVLRQTAPDMWKNLVFMQNGMLQPWLRKNGLQENTQMLLYMSSSPENVQNPKSRMKIVTGDKETLVWGRMAPRIAELMHSAGLPCSEVTHEEFLKGAIEKLLWSSIFWLLSAALGGLPVGEIAKNHRNDVVGLTCELLPLAKNDTSSSKVDDTWDETIMQVEGMASKLCDYSMAIPTSVPSVSMAESEFSWRNGWFLEQKRSAVHVMWLRKAGFANRVSQYS